MKNLDAEQLLIRRAQRGDPAAFAKIYDLYQPAVNRYIRYRVSDTQDVDDLTSDVFVRLVERIDRFTFQGRPILAWLYTIARNLITDYYRRAGRENISPLDERLVADTIAPEEHAETALSLQWLSKGLQQLTEDQRQVIILKFIEGFANAQVARILGKPVSAVKSLQHRGLAALRRLHDRDMNNI